MWIMPERYVISYSDIPEDLVKFGMLDNYSPDCFVSYSISNNPEDDSPLDTWFREEYLVLAGKTFLIDMDY